VCHQLRQQHHRGGGLACSIATRTGPCNQQHCASRFGAARARLMLHEPAAGKRVWKQVTPAAPAAPLWWWSCLQQHNATIYDCSSTGASPGATAVQHRQIHCAMYVAVLLGESAVQVFQQGRCQGS
jgi:hypothetical protein